jgi:hypothetical protein
VDPPLTALRHAFPDYNFNTLPDIPDGWVDESNIVDDTPHFRAPLNGGDGWAVIILIDFPKPDDRVLPDQRRYGIRLDVGDDPGASFYTNDWREIVTRVKDLQRAFNIDGYTIHFKHEFLKEEDLNPHDQTCLVLKNSEGDFWELLDDLRAYVGLEQFQWYGHPGDISARLWRYTNSPL